MKKINWKTVGKTVGKCIGYVGGAMLYSFAAMSAFKYTDQPVAIRDNTAAGYNEAVEAIMKSDMAGWYKNDAIQALKKDGNVEFYRAIIHIVSDRGTADWYRVDMIKKLSQ